MTEFEEYQQFRQWWFLVLLAFVAIAGWAPLITDLAIAGDTSTDPFWLLVIIGVLSLLLPAWLLFIRMETTVDAEGVHLRYRGATVRRTYPFGEINQFEAVTYRPLAQYGGWGIRWRGRGKIAYSVSGKEGVRMNLVDDKEVLLGSLRADELAAAIRGRVRR